MNNTSLSREPSIHSSFSYHEPQSTMFSSKSQPQSALSNRFSGSSDLSERGSVRFRQHSLSGTSAFCSNESSPTTTCSTVDDSSATDPSPGSSPESPPSSIYPPSMDLRLHDGDEKPTSFFGLQQVVPSARKGRNLKNLAVNTSRTTGQAGALTGLPAGLQRQESAPSILSPAFVKPPDPQKRRPSNLGLTILTPSSTNASPKPIRLAIPPTPGLGKPPALRHFQSSPSLPLLTGFGATSAMAVTLASLDTAFSPIEPMQKSILAGHEDDHNYDIPLSREDKPEAYPDGPICVYSPYIDLYLEPTAEQARQYGVVLNVASEVLNPLDTTTSFSSAPDTQLRIDGGGGIQYAPSRRPAAINADDEVKGSPTTPKATPPTGAFSPSVTSPAPDPEYIHIPWEHNSDIVPDLLGLCKLIDDKVQEQKRILIHCQCGVSRSASLVVAYGLYKNPTLSVQEAYDAVKQKSKWIGPNMNLIMQLQEFRSRLSGQRGLSPITPTSALSEWGGPFSAHTNDVGLYPGSLSAKSSAPPTSKSEHFEAGVKSSLTSSVQPWSTSIPTGRSRAISSARNLSAYVDPAGHVLPVLGVIEPLATTPKPVQLILPKLTSESTPSTNDPSSIRAAEFAMTELSPAKDVDPADTFGIMSPTSTGLATNPFDRPALLAQLGMTTVTQQSKPTRTRSLKASKPADDASRLAAPWRLRGKISSPTLREQHQLQDIQAQLEAQLPRRQLNAESPGLGVTLMSPRATEFIQNPFALAFNPKPAQLAAPPAIDPRSPATKGASPIIRNIEDFL